MELLCVVLHYHVPFLCSMSFGNYVFCTSGFMSVLCAPATFLLLFCRNGVYCAFGSMDVLCVPTAFLLLPLWELYFSAHLGT